jgi:hypothetical protein
VDLLVDPFGPGVDVSARIQALEFQSLLFLFSPESWKSKYCQAELAAARVAWVPVFSIRWSGELPEPLRNRIFVDRAGRADAEIVDKLHGFAQAIRVRGSIRRLIEKLRFPNMPETVRDAAQRLADEPDRTALTEFLDCLEQTYSAEMDPIARGSLAFAVGKTGAEKANQILCAWRSPQDHPYPQECISQALEWVKNKQAVNKGGSNECTQNQTVDGDCSGCPLGSDSLQPANDRTGDSQRPDEQTLPDQCQHRSPGRCR